MKTERAWAAGFFDGEGTVVAFRPERYKTAQVTLAIAQLERATLVRFRAAVGAGTITGPYKYKTNQRPYYKWFSGAKADVEKVRTAMWPFLGNVKRRAFSRAYKEAQRAVQS